MDVFKQSHRNLGANFISSDNKGADKQDQGAYAQSGPPAANGAGAAAEQEVGAAAIPTYEVDKSKKKKTLDEPKKVFIFVFLIC